MDSVKSVDFSAVPNQPTAEKAANTFRIYDTNGKHYLDNASAPKAVQELGSLFGLTMKQLCTILGLDKFDHTRQVSFPEFMTFYDRLIHFQLNANRSIRIREYGKLPNVPEGAEHNELLQRVFRNYCRYTVGQGRLVFDETNPAMSNSQFLKLCQDLGMIAPLGPVETVDVDLVFLKCRRLPLRRLYYLDWLRAIAAVAQLSGIDVFELAGGIGARLKPKGDCFEAAPIIISPQANVPTLQGSLLDDFIYGNESNALNGAVGSGINAVRSMAPPPKRAIASAPSSDVSDCFSFDRRGRGGKGAGSSLAADGEEFRRLHPFLASDSKLCSGNPEGAGSKLPPWISDLVAKVDDLSDQIAHLKAHHAADLSSSGVLRGRVLRASSASAVPSGQPQVGSHMVCAIAKALAIDLSSGAERVLRHGRDEKSGEGGGGGRGGGRRGGGEEGRKGEKTVEKGERRFAGEENGSKPSLYNPNSVLTSPKLLSSKVHSSAAHEQSRDKPGSKRREQADGDTAISWSELNSGCISSLTGYAITNLLLDLKSKQDNIAIWHDESSERLSSLEGWRESFGTSLSDKVCRLSKQTASLKESLDPLVAAKASTNHSVAGLARVVETQKSLFSGIEKSFSSHQSQSLTTSQTSADDLRGLGNLKVALSALEERASAATSCATALEDRLKEAKTETDPNTVDRLRALEDSVRSMMDKLVNPESNQSDTNAQLKSESISKFSNLEASVASLNSAVRGVQDDVIPALQAQQTTAIEKLQSLSTAVTSIEERLEKTIRFQFENEKSVSSLESMFTELNSDLSKTKQDCEGMKDSITLLSGASSNPKLAWHNESLTPVETDTAKEMLHSATVESKMTQRMDELTEVLANTGNDLSKVLIDVSKLKEDFQGVNMLRELVNEDRQEMASNLEASIQVLRAEVQVVKAQSTAVCAAIGLRTEGSGEIMVEANMEGDNDSRRLNDASKNPLEESIATAGKDSQGRGATPVPQRIIQEARKQAQEELGLFRSKNDAELNTIRMELDSIKELAEVVRRGGTSVEERLTMAINSASEMAKELQEVKATASEVPTRQDVTDLKNKITEETDRRFGIQTSLASAMESVKSINLEVSELSVRHSTLQQQVHAIGLKQESFEETLAATAMFTKNHTTGQSTVSDSIETLTPPSVPPTSIDNASLSHPNSDAAADGASDSRTSLDSSNLKELLEKPETSISDPINKTSQDDQDYASKASVAKLEKEAENRDKQLADLILRVDKKAERRLSQISEILSRIDAKFRESEKKTLVRLEIHQQAILKEAKQIDRLQTSLRDSDIFSSTTFGKSNFTFLGENDPLVDLQLIAESPDPKLADPPNALGTK